MDDRATEAVRYERNHLTLLAASDQGFRNLVKLSSAGYLEGYRRGKANVDLELLVAPLGGRAGAHGLPAVARLPPPRGRVARRGARPRRRPDAGVRSRQRLLRGAEERGLRSGAGQRGDRRDRARGRPAAGGHGRRSLPAARGLRQPSRPAVRADQEHARPAEAVVRHQRVLPQEHGRDGPGLRRLARGARHHARDRRALPGRDRAGQDADPALPHARGGGRVGLPAPAWHMRDCAAATATRRLPRRSSGSRWSSR